MARARTIKHGFFTNDQLGELPATTRILFAGLWTIADRDGRLLDRPKKIKAEILPYDDVDVDQALEQLAADGFIARYVSDDQACIQILKWSKHQHPHPREEKSQLPPPADFDEKPAVDDEPDLGAAEPDLGDDEPGRSPVSGPLAFPSGSRSPVRAVAGQRARGRATTGKATATTNGRSPPRESDDDGTEWCQVEQPDGTREWVLVEVHAS